MAGFIAFISNIISWIGNILTVRSLIGRRSGNRSIKDLHSRSKVVENPVLILGDRANEKEGFRDKDYLKREDVDGILEENFNVKNPKDREHNIVVIAGRHASGKSRVVWEFIRSDIGDLFKSVYIPRISTDVDIQDNKTTKNDDLRQEMARIKPSTFVVLDDIDNLLEMGYRGLTPKSLLEILARINDRDQACIITLSNTVQNYKEILTLLNSDSALGRRKTKRILFLEIEDIKLGDETFLWCTANLPMIRYSKVIGGYIPQLTRYADVYIQRIVNEPSALLYLTSFIILKKFWNHFKVLEEHISRLYRTIRTKDRLEDLPLEPEQDRTRVLFDTGMLRHCSNGIEVEVDDERLFDSFSFYCATHGKSNLAKDMLIRKYLTESLSAEREQVIRLIEADHGENPAIYSRVITRSYYPELRSKVTNWFIKKFFKYSNENSGENLLPLSIKPEYESDPSRLPEIEFAASIIVGRALDPINCSKAFLEARIAPNITLVNGLIRASMDHKMPQVKNAIKSYALKMKEDFKIEDDLYFCQVMEASESDYNEERIKRALDIYDNLYDIYSNISTKDEEKLDYLENTMSRYRSRLVEKADSRERIIQYFTLLRDHPEISPERGFVRKLVYKISSKAGSSAAPLFQLLSEELIAATPIIIREEVCELGLLCIMDNCPDIQICLSLYERIAPKVESSMQPAFSIEYKKKDKFLNLLAMRLASKMKRLSLESIEYEKIQSILKERVLCAYQNNDFGAADKLYNIVLNNHPLNPVNKALDHLISLYKDESWLSGKRNIDNLNSAFQNAIEPYDAIKKRFSVKGMNKEDRCIQLRHIAFIFNELREEANIQADGRFKLFLYRIIDLIRRIDAKSPTDDIRNLIKFNEDVERLKETTLKKEELLWCQVIRLSDSPDIPLKAAEICLRLAEKGDYLMDTLNHLIRVFCNRFFNNMELKGILQALAKMTYDAIPHTIHDYCHYLALNIKTGTLRDEKEVMLFIDEAWTRLQNLDLPLRDANKADIICAAINIRSFDLQQAIDIVNFAIDYDRSYRYRSTPILTQDVILELAKKFRKEENDRNENPERWATNKDVLLDYAHQIQDIIYTLDTVYYPSKDFVFKLIKNPIDAPLADKYGRKEFTRIPMESDMPDIRRTALLKRIDENGRARCSEYEANVFLSQELFYANYVIRHDCFQGNESHSDIGNYVDYILLILESMWDAERTVDITSVNKDRFQKVFQKIPRWQYFDNFFEGYLLGGYIPEGLTERWRKAADDYGYSIRG